MVATAAASLTGTEQGILTRRGSVEATLDGTPVFLTVHQSWILRLTGPELQAEERIRFRDDLRVVVRMVG